jgi:hypothetical protein
VGLPIHQHITLTSLTTRFLTGACTRSTHRRSEISQDIPVINPVMVISKKLHRRVITPNKLRNSYKFRYPTGHQWSIQSVPIPKTFDKNNSPVNFFFLNLLLFRGTATRCGAVTCYLTTTAAKNSYVLPARPPIQAPAIHACHGLQPARGRPAHK